MVWQFIWKLFSYAVTRQKLVFNILRHGIILVFCIFGSVMPFLKFYFPSQVWFQNRRSRWRKSLKNKPAKDLGNDVSISTIFQTVARQFPAAHAPDDLKLTWAIFPAIYHQPFVHTILWEHGAHRFTRFTNCQCNAWPACISFCDAAVQLQCLTLVQLQRTVPGLLLEGSLLARWLFSRSYFGQWLSAWELVDRTL